jgi:hypothetical protein
MSHLTLEDLARLVDDAPNAHEAAHLGSCAQCRAELDAMRDDVQSLSLLPDVAPTADGWAALEARLAQEGLIHGRTRPAAWPHVMKAAAALVLFLAGSAAGRLTAGPDGRPLADATDNRPAAQAAPTSAGPQPAYASADEPAAEPTQPAAPQDLERTPAPQRNPDVALASSGFSLTSQPRTMEEAIEQLRAAEDLYVTALTRYAEMATRSDSGDPVARLAALQSIVMTTQAALNQTPTDPVINGYHLNVLAHRDATLRQVAAASGDRWY